MDTIMISKDEWAKIEKIYYSAQNGGFVLDCKNRCCFSGDMVVDDRGNEYTLRYDRAFHVWNLIAPSGEEELLSDNVIELV